MAIRKWLRIVGRTGGNSWGVGVATLVPICVLGLTGEDALCNR